MIFCPERWQSDGIVYPTPAWLGRELPARLARWSVASGSSGFKSTLSLLPILKYSHTYQELKDKYKHVVQVMLAELPLIGPPVPPGADELRLQTQECAQLCRGKRCSYLLFGM